MKAIFAAMNTTARVFIAAKIAFIFTSLSAVQMYDFHIFTFVYNIYYQSIKKEYAKSQVRIQPTQKAHATRQRFDIRKLSATHAYTAYWGTHCLCFKAKNAV